MGAAEGATSEVARVCSDLIRINTSNPTHPELPAAMYVRTALEAIGLDVEWLESEPGRVSLVSRVKGSDASLPPLLVHTHLDVVPAEAADWSVDPFGGDIADGYVWGRGAVDMKGMVAAVLVALRQLHEQRRQPRRDIVLAFFADEEGGGRLGAAYVAQRRPDLFEGCATAIGEVGGFSIQLPGVGRAYLVSAAEKGVIWARLRAQGTPGHASFLNTDNPLNTLIRAMPGITDPPTTADRGAAVDAFFDAIRKAYGDDLTDSEILSRLGPISRVIEASMSNTITPTMLSGGYKSNVVPSSAEATVDVRYVPGGRDRMLDELISRAGDRLEVEPFFVADAVEAPLDHDMFAAIERALQREDPGCFVVPYMSTAFTDAKWLAGLGIDCYGFFPLQLPPELDFSSLFHGADERVPVSALDFCVRVLHDLIENY